MDVYLRLIKLAKPYWKIIVVGLIVSLLFVIFNASSVWLTASFVKVIFPSGENQQVEEAAQLETNVSVSINEKLKDITNTLIIKETPLETLRTLCFVILVAFLLKNVFYYIKEICLSYVQFQLITELRNRLYSHLHNLSLSFFHRKRSGEISSIIVNDVNVLQHTFSTSFNKLIVEPLNIIVFMFILFVISWRLTLLAIIILPMSGIIITKVGQSIRRKSVRTSKQIAGIMSVLNETLHGIRIVKAFAMEQFEKSRFFNETKKYFNLLFRRKKLQTVSSPINEIIGVFIGVILLWYGGSQVLAGTGLESEDFIRYIAMLFAVMQPLKNLNNVNVDIQQGIASGSRVFSILDEKPDVVEKPDAIKLEGFKKEIEYDHVYFRYNNSSEDVLSDINFTIKKGEVVAIVGHSGAGKSTIADLLPRFYDVKDGKITIDGIDIRDVTLKSLRSLMGIVTQETILFNDTIFNNIAYGVGNSDIELVKESALMANAMEFINEMPEGFQTIVGERGARLSAGQRQRIAIARALLKNPPILILDEATSSLDTESEKKVQQAIETLMKDRTVLVIAHRLSTIQNADKIIVLENGRIVEIGKHEELLNKEGSLYSYLYRIQFDENLVNNPS